MTRVDKIAETLKRFNPRWSVNYRDMCRQVADDLGLDGPDRERFLHESGAITRDLQPQQRNARVA